MTVTPAPMVVTALLPAVLDDDSDERAVTDTLLDLVDLAAGLEHLIDGLAELLTHATAAATRRAYESDFSRATEVNRGATAAVLRALRDRALLLVGFAAALRRSELSAWTSVASPTIPPG